MRIIITLIFLAVATASYADTYKWEDENGIHFTENANSIPKKYRAKALAEASGDITTTHPSVAHDAIEKNSRNSERESQEQAEENILKGNEEKREIPEKLAKTKCEGGIPGECGPGRVCVYHPFIKKSGVCRTEAEANYNLTQRHSGFVITE